MKDWTYPAPEGYISKDIYAILISPNRQKRIFPITFWRRIFLGYNILILEVSKFISWVWDWMFKNVSFLWNWCYPTVMCHSDLHIGGPDSVYGWLFAGLTFCRVDFLQGWLFAALTFCRVDFFYGWLFTDPPVIYTSFAAMGYKASVTWCKLLL
jgi:hypothetical protein